MFLHVDGVILNTDFIITCTPTVSGGNVKVNDGTNNGVIVTLDSLHYSRLVAALEDEMTAIRRARAEAGARTR